MNVREVLDSLPNTKGVVIILSGGMDSTIAMRLCVERYGYKNVKALTFNYGQKQAIEIEKARESTRFLLVEHKVLDLSVLGDLSKGFSANVDKSIEMPTIKDVLGDPTPKTYVPNRNMILMSLAAAYAETQGLEYIVTGLQSVDEYGYWDTTASFVDKMNSVFNENRKIKIKLIAPFVKLNKFEEIKLLEELDGGVGLLMSTLTCYNPDELGRSCGKCPSCSERIANFAKAGHIDHISYAIDIPWSKLCAQS
jgi:7-cyano-7-deazaguanine synthase